MKDKTDKQLIREMQARLTHAVSQSGEGVGFIACKDNTINGFLSTTSCSTKNVVHLIGCMGCVYTQLQSLSRWLSEQDTVNMSYDEIWDLITRQPTKEVDLKDEVQE